MGGPAQSRFFYRLALEHLPDWLLALIRTERASICDWGCATGDGTDVLAQVLGTPVVGVDFSDAAIRIAQERYRRPSYVAVDFLASGASELTPTYDILFTSNTLEHFVDPWGALTKVSALAKQALVVLLPYREYERHHEHEATFEARNVPITVGREFHLVHSRVVDTRAHVPCFWNGEQILLVYAHASVADRRGLRLADVAIAMDAANPIDPEVAKLRQQLDDVQEQVNAGLKRELALRGELEVVQQGRVSVAIERDQLQAAAAAKQEEISHLCQQLAGLQTQVGVSASLGAMVRDDLEAARSARASLEAERDKLRAAAQAAEQELGRVRQQLEAVQETANAERDQLRAAAQAAEEELGKLRQQLEAAQASANAERDQLRAAAEAAQQELGRVRLDLEALEAANAERERLGQATDAADHDLGSVRERLEAMQADVAAERGQLRAAASTAQNEIDSLRRQLHAVQAQVSTGLTFDAALRDELDAAQSRYLEVRAELDRVREANGTGQAELRLQADACAAEIDRLRDELKAALRRALDQEESEQRATAEKNELMLRLSALEREVSSRDAYLAALEQDNAAKEAFIRSQEALIEAIHVSRSWRLTRPVRGTSRLARKTASSVRSGAWSVARGTVRLAPVPQSWKTQLRALVLGAPAPAPLVAPPTAPAVIETPSAPEPDRDENSRVAALVPPLRGPRGLADVFVWGIIDWHFRIQRPQHIARGLARRGHRTFYFSNHFVDSAEPGYRIEPVSEDGLLSIVYLHVAGVPSIYTAAASEATDKALTESLAVFLVDAGASSIISMVQHPFWTPFADKVPNRRLIYDMMDHHEGFGDGAPDILELEARILREADQVVVTSDFLEKIARSKNGSVVVVRNACEYQHFATRPEDVFRDPKGRRVIGYYGAIAHWFDADLVAKVARRFPDDLVLLVGADSVGVQERLKEYPNVQFTGEVKYTELPYYLYGFDVCLLPFKVIPLTLATNPVKVYEYLSAGRSIVSVDLPEIAQFPGLVAVGRSDEEFLDHVERALRRPPSSEEIQARRLFASGQTWDERASTLAQAVESFTPPRVSVIVVTYNKVELTDACLRGLERNTHYPNVEIIVVDNNSRDDTPDYLRKWAERGENRIAILNDENRGFAAANNQGLERATGEYFVLLNNDTYVTPGWLGTLVRHLQRDPTLGLVGPVTNSIGNEARIELAYSTMDEMERAARGYTAANMGKLYPLRTAAFFCVAFSRTLYNEVGPLDEAFGIGMFEDDDYCRRVEQAGRHSACAEDVFVHHHLSASFNEIAAEGRVALFLANREIYERKWGAWIPHTYRPTSVSAAI